MNEGVQPSPPEIEGESARRKCAARLQAPEISSGIILAILISITAVGAWLRLQSLGTANLWLDEAYSVLFAHMPVGQFWKLMWSREGNMLLYYGFLRVWAHLGDTEFLLRLPSVLFAVLSVPAIYLLGGELFGRMAGLIAAALLSVHMFHVFLSRQARSYSLLVLLLLLSCWLFVKFTDAPQRRLLLLAYAVVSALAVYAHLFAFLVIASQWLVIAGERGRRVGWRRIATTIALIIVLALPMEAFMLLKNRGQLDWVPALTKSTFLDGLHAIAGYGNGWLSGLYAVLAIGAIVIRARTEDEAFAVRLLEVWLFFPAVLMLLYSLHKPVFYSRFLVICVPALILLSARALTTIMQWRPQGMWVSVALGVIIFGMSLKGSWDYVRAPACADWRPATQWLVAHARSEDAICFAGTGAEVFLYYMQREKHMPWSDLPSVRYSQGARCFGYTPEKIAESNSPYQRGWLLKTDASPQQYRWISHMLARRFGLSSQEGSFGCPVGKITVELLR